MTTTIKVISAAVSQTGAVFYTEDGEEKTISVTDPRVAKMVDQVIQAVNAGKIPVEVDMTTYSVFAQIEEESGGLLKFFRVAKKKLGSLLGIRSNRGPVNGDGFVQNVPKNEKGEEVAKVQPGTEPITDKMIEALGEAHKEAETTSLPIEETTVVAVVDKTPIVGAEALEKHAKAAVASGETIGFRKLVERLGAVAAKRKHTVQEALVFLQRMDLPFANDGSIVAYKSLTTTSEEGVFIDNHSKTLKQGLGTFVQMDVELVDDNRRVLCSNGLHVAQRGYLSGYGTSGNNVVCLIKIAPEDVISVPMNESQKMRVRAYHIVAVLSNDDMKAIANQKSFTLENMDQASLLAKVIRGEHVPVLNITTQHKGRQVDQMVPVANPKAPLVLGKEMAVLHTVDEAVSVAAATPIDVKSINEKLKTEDPKKKESKAANHSKAFVLFNLWDKLKTQAAWDDLMAFRKSFGFWKGWPANGLTQKQTDMISAEIRRRKKLKRVADPVLKPTPAPKLLKAPAKKPAPVKKTAAKPAAPKKEEAPKVKPGEVTKILKTGAKKAAANAKAAAAADKAKKGPKPNKVRVAFDHWKRTPTDQMVEVVRVAKKAAKKSWEALGFTESEIKLIKEKIDK